ncbi:MAG TPA: tetratricopeptide repeat protein, partial [Chitinophagaceae bacterium]|nr:tetratricopeptide repeat protein [Chitinophagaceae bacterium]
MSQPRQLAAIMFTDIVGYTAIMQQNEEKAVAVIKHYNSVLEKWVTHFNGQVINYYGDGSLCTFSSATDAVNCSLAVQKDLKFEPVVPLRIGLHIGEVFFEDAKALGDGVNVASRVQSLGQENTILVSEEIYDKIKNNPSIIARSLGHFDFKNVGKAMEVFALTNEGLFVPQRKKMKGKLKKKNGQKQNVIAALSLIMIVAATFFVYKNLFDKKNKASDKSIAVLPFVDMSAAKDQEYFSDGLSEELLNLLSKIPELKVIGRTSSFSFKGKNEDLRIIGEKLGVAHILEGSVRREGNKIRVTSQLIRTADGSHLWSEKYDREMADIFKLQDEIATAVVQQLKLKLLEIPSAKPTTRNIEAYNLILQGNYFYDRLDKESVAKAVEFYYKALAIDSTDVRAWVCLTNAISRQSWQNYIDQDTGYEKARQTALKAIELDPTYASGFSELADIKQYYDFDWKGAEKDYQTALKLEPSNADISNSFGDLLHALGHYSEAEQYHRKALEFNPLKPLLYMSLASDLSYPGKFAEAIPYFKKVLELDPQYQRAHLYIGRNYIMMGKPELALEEIQKENMEVFKNFGIAAIYFSLNRKKEADEKLNEFIEKYQDHWRYLIAQLYAFRNEKEEAFKWLESAY